MIAILNCDVFPGLELQDPLSTKDDDIIPDKFGQKWYEYSDKPTKVFKPIDNDNESKSNSQ